MIHHLAYPTPAIGQRPSPLNPAIHHTKSLAACYDVVEFDLTSVQAYTKTCCWRIYSLQVIVETGRIWRDANMGQITHYIIVVAPETEHNLLANLTDPLATVLPEYIHVYKTDTPDVKMGVVDGLQPDTAYITRIWPYDDFGPGRPTQIATFRTEKPVD